MALIELILLPTIPDHFFQEKAQINSLSICLNDFINDYNSFLNLKPFSTSSPFPSLSFQDYPNQLCSQISSLSNKYFSSLNLIYASFNSINSFSLCNEIKQQVYNIQIIIQDLNLQFNSLLTEKEEDKNIQSNKTKIINELNDLYESILFINNTHDKQKYNLALKEKNEELILHCINNYNCNNKLKQNNSNRINQLTNEINTLYAKLLYNVFNVIAIHTNKLTSVFSDLINLINTNTISIVKNTLINEDDTINEDVKNINVNILSLSDSILKEITNETENIVKYISDINEYVTSYRKRISKINNSINEILLIYLDKQIKKINSLEKKSNKLSHFEMIFKYMKDIYNSFLSGIKKFYNDYSIKIESQVKKSEKVIKNDMECSYNLLFKILLRHINT